MIDRPGRHVIALALCASLIACGKKGPPLPPLHILPDAVSDVTARRAGDEVQLRFVLPARNTNGPPPVNLDRVEIYAATVDAGAAAPTPRELAASKFLVGTVAVKPAADPDEQEPAVKDDPRPAPGEPVTFTEQLDTAKLQPQFTTPAAPPASAAAATADKPPVQTVSPPAAAPTPPLPAGSTTPRPALATAAPLPPVPSRMYLIRGIARNGRAGPPAAVVTVPLGAVPPAPTNVAADFTAMAIAITWVPPVAEEGKKPPLFNVYRADAPVPLNPKPLAEPSFERAGVEFGTEECFVVRTVETFGSVRIESAAPLPVCVTPKDVFPPEAPKGLSVAAAEGVISLIWDRNTETDLGGYLILRGESPGDTLQAITPAPIKETSYRDTTVKPGVRYVYAVVAVDGATPPNVSPQSVRVEEVAR